jgi:hypothetical protein
MPTSDELGPFSKLVPEEQAERDGVRFGGTEAERCTYMMNTGMGI